MISACHLEGCSCRAQTVGRRDQRGDVGGAVGAGAWDGYRHVLWGFKRRGTGRGRIGDGGVRAVVCTLRIQGLRPLADFVGRAFRCEVSTRTASHVSGPNKSETQQLSSTQQVPGLRAAVGLRVAYPNARARWQKSDRPTAPGLSRSSGERLTSSARAGHESHIAYTKELTAQLG